MSKLSRLPIDLMHHGWDRTAIALQQIFARASAKPAIRRTLIYLQAVQHLRRSFQGQSNGDYPVLVINRDRDASRLAKFGRCCARYGIRYERLPAVDLTDAPARAAGLASFIGDNFYGQDRFLRGAVGCFLSHITAWQLVVERGLELAMVCEDDARFLGPLPSSLSAFNLPETTELVFANQRTGGGLLEESYYRQLGEGRLLSVPAGEASAALLRNFTTVMAIGTDGYLVTRRGAEKLLDMVRRYRITMEVDWFLFFHSLSPAERADFLRGHGKGWFDRLAFPEDRLETRVLLPFLVEQTEEESTINFSNPRNRVPRAELLPVSNEIGSPTKP